jgi:hypothetical protein
VPEKADVQGKAETIHPLPSGSVVAQVHTSQTSLYVGAGDFLLFAKNQNVLLYRLLLGYIHKLF